MSDKNEDEKAEPLTPVDIGLMAFHNGFHHPGHKGCHQGDLVRALEAAVEAAYHEHHGAKGPDISDDDDHDPSPSEGTTEPVKEDMKMGGTLDDQVSVLRVRGKDFPVTTVRAGDNTTNRIVQFILLALHAADDPDIDAVLDHLKIEFMWPDQKMVTPMYDRPKDEETDAGPVEGPS